MRFIDEARLYVRSGKGGDGVIRFRREKFVPRGGPNGGDGGNGGSIIFEADTGRSTLLDLRIAQRYIAVDGEDGGNNQRTGHNGEDKIIKVPVGTLFYDADTQELLADLVTAGDRFVAAQGGHGGKGNQHFATSTNQAPRHAEPGTPSQERNLRVELKLLADVGLVGFPNAGKSTLISRVSAARPRIADYPFTTLVPNLGVVRLGEDRTFVMADIPGLIEGSSQGAGLGHRFLRHIERTRLFLHLISLVEYDSGTPWERFCTLNAELGAFSEHLLGTPQIVVLTKVDALPDPEEQAEVIRPFEEHGLKVYVISAHSGLGLQELLFEVGRRLDQLDIRQPDDDLDPPAG